MLFAEITFYDMISCNTVECHQIMHKKTLQYSLKSFKFQCIYCLARKSIKNPFITLFIPEKAEYLLISVSASYIPELKALYI